jgi:hypothetical protein
MAAAAIFFTIRHLGKMMNKKSLPFWGKLFNDLNIIMA